MIHSYNSRLVVEWHRTTSALQDPMMSKMYWRMALIRSEWMPLRVRHSFEYLRGFALESAFKYLREYSLQVPESIWESMLWEFQSVLQRVLERTWVRSWEYPGVCCFKSLRSTLSLELALSLCGVGTDLFLLTVCITTLCAGWVLPVRHALRTCTQRAGWCVLTLRPLSRRIHSVDQLNSKNWPFRRLS